MNDAEHLIYEFGPYHLHADEGLLLCQGKVVPLTPKVFDTLMALVKRSGHVLSKDELMETLWPDTFTEESSLAQNIFLLRKALGERGPKHQYIETVPKRGYRFISDVKMLETGHAGLDATHATAINALNNSQAGLGVKLNTLAVLPFRRLNPQNEDSLLGLALADAIIVKLNSLGLFTTLPTTSVFKYAARRIDALTIGRRLAAGVVLDGAVQHSAERIRVTWQLVRLKDAVVLCSGKLDDRYCDLFTLQDAIAEQVAEALSLKLGGARGKPASRHYTDNIEAYQHYIKGRFFWDKRTEDALKKSVQYFEQAISIDPDYAIAHAGLADSYSLLGSYLFLPPGRASAQARLAAERAAQMDDTLAETHASLAEIRYFYRWDWAGAEEEFKLSIKLNPHTAVTHHLYGWFLLTQERLDEAADEFNTARDLEPLSLVYSASLGLPFHYKRQYNRAIKLYRQTLEMNPNYAIANYYLGSALLYKGDYDDALAAFDKLYEIEYTPQLTTLMGCAYAATGERGAALKELEKLKALSTQRYISPYNIALVYSALGETNEALDWLERAYDERSAWLVFLKIDPGFDRLRTHPRFRHLLSRVGLVSS